MKIAILSLAVILMASSASAFAPAPAFSRGLSTSLFAGEEEKEEEGFDLDLGEMFEMFDAADKEENFDDAVKKVKGDKK